MLIISRKFFDEFNNELQKDLVQHFKAGYKHNNNLCVANYEKIQYGKYIGEDCSNNFNKIFKSLKNKYIKSTNTTTKNTRNKKVQGDLISLIVHDNNYDSLINKINKLKNQTWTNTEIIVINLNNNDSRFFNKIDDCTVLHTSSPKDLSGEKLKNWINDTGKKLAIGKWVIFVDDISSWR